jgi:hypothetical protein
MSLPEPLKLQSSFSRFGDSVRQRVMLFEPCKGWYPRGTFFCEGGFFHADDDLIFSVVRCSGWQAIDEELPYSEFDWAWPNQVRMLGALLFCEVIDGPRMLLYPFAEPQLSLEPCSLDLGSQSVVAEIKNHLLFSASEATGTYAPRVPRKLLREPFSLVASEEYGMARFAPAFNAIDPENFVLMRGLQALVKADMLGRHQEFGEESVISTFIALEASFQLVLRKLKKEGLSNPSAHDAAQWMHRHFDEPWGIDAPEALDKYFDEFYRNRISTLHPACRFGDFPFSLTMWDDALHLRAILRQVFSFLVHGRHFSDFDDAVADFHARSPQSH